MPSARDQDTVAPLTGWVDFGTTHWNVVLAAGDTHSPQAAEALETLCRAYWHPLYAYVRRQGHSPEEAQDLTQEFFLRLLRKQYVKHADPECGRFRTYLLTSLKHFLVSEWRKTERLKRGGGQVLLQLDTTAAEQCYAAQPLSAHTPEEIYERSWAITLMERVLTQLREEYYAPDKDRLFEALKHRVWGDESPQSYAAIAVEHGLSEEAVKASVHRLRQRCRALLRLEVAQTVAGPEEIDEELRHLIKLFTK